MFNQTEKQERSYLQQIINRLKQIISHTDVSVKDHVDTLAEYKDYLWSNKDIDPHEIRSMRESILNHFAIGESVIDKRRRLAKIVDIPYFGRIDFQEKSENHPIIPIVWKGPPFRWYLSLFKAVLPTIHYYILYRTSIFDCCFRRKEA